MIYEPDGSKTYDHEPVPVCGDCGDPLEDDSLAEYGYRHAYEEVYERPQHYDTGYHGDPMDANPYTIYEVIDLVKRGKAVVLQGAYEGGDYWAILSKGERAMLDFLFPDV